jgi:hypothetical protein
MPPVLLKTLEFQIKALHSVQRSLKCVLNHRVLRLQCSTQDVSTPHVIATKDSGTL